MPFRTNIITSMENRESETKEMSGREKSHSSFKYKRSVEISTTAIKTGLNLSAK